MLLNPNQAIAEGWITLPPGIDFNNIIQPNAIDFTIDIAYQLTYQNCDEVSGFELTKLDKKHIDRLQVMYENNFFTIPSNGVIDFSSLFTVNLPAGVAAMLVPRSTLTRNGITLHSGLYDSGYEGAIGATLINHSLRPAKIECGSRIGQIIFIPSDSSSIYAGGYNHSTTHWSASDNVVQ